MLIRLRLVLLAAAAMAGEAALAEFPPAPYYAANLRGDFVVYQTSTREFFGTQADNFPLAVSWPGDLVLAFAHWTYLTNSPGHSDEAAITIDGNAVVGTLTGQTPADTVWGFNHVAAYTADVTALVQAIGPGTYTIGGAIDEPATGAIGEGFSILMVFRDGVTPRHVRVYTGADNSNEFFPDTEFIVLDLAPAYTAGPVHFFTNALDGQEDLFEDFYINGLNRSGPPFTGGSVGNAFIGAEGPPGPFGRVKYDRAEGEISSQLTGGETFVGFQTRGDFVSPDAIGHTLAALAYEVDLVPGDNDFDGDVDLADLAVMLANFGIQTGASIESGDTDGDSDVDIQDLSTLVSHFGSVP